MSRTASVSGKKPEGQTTVTGDRSTREALDEGALRIDERHTGHRLGVEHVHIGEALYARGQRLVEKVRVRAKINGTVAQPVALPGDPERRDDKVDAVHHAAEARGVGRGGEAHVIRVEARPPRRLPAPDQGAHLPAARLVLGDKVAAEIAAGTRDQNRGPAPGALHPARHARAAHREDRASCDGAA